MINKDVVDEKEFCFWKLIVEFYFAFLDEQSADFDPRVFLDKGAFASWRFKEVFTFDRVYDRREWQWREKMTLMQVFMKLEVVFEQLLGHPSPTQVDWRQIVTELPSDAEWTIEFVCRDKIETVKADWVQTAKWLNSTAWTGMNIAHRLEQLYEMVDYDEEEDDEMTDEDSIYRLR